MIFSISLSVRLTFIESNILIPNKMKCRYWIKRKLPVRVRDPAHNLIKVTSRTNRMQSELIIQKNCAESFLTQTREKTEEWEIWSLASARSLFFLSLSLFFFRFMKSGTRGNIYVWNSCMCTLAKYLLFHIKSAEMKLGCWEFISTIAAETTPRYRRYERREVPREINGVHVGVRLKLLAACPVCIRQKTRHARRCLYLHRSDDAVEVPLVDASTWVNNLICRHGPLLSDWAEVGWPRLPPCEVEATWLVYCLSPPAFCALLLCLFSDLFGLWYALQWCPFRASPLVPLLVWDACSRPHLLPV